MGGSGRIWGAGPVHERVAGRVGSLRYGRQGCPRFPGNGIVRPELSIARSPVMPAWSWPRSSSRRGRRRFVARNVRLKTMLAKDCDIGGRLQGWGRLLICSRFGSQNIMHGPFRPSGARSQSGRGLPQSKPWREHPAASTIAKRRGLRSRCIGTAFPRAR
jgi:hypothetical protein